MAQHPSSPDAFRAELDELVEILPQLKHKELIQQALQTLVQLAEVETDRLDWKILNSSLVDMGGAFRAFYPYRHVRKVSIFGSARVEPTTQSYQMAVEFAEQVTQMGFMVMTGAGGGIMQAGNQGAGVEASFGLNIQLPFEQGANPFIEGDRKLINFKYFFTRKLFFLRESDALVLFPGGFGTLDEAFECLTLMQTGKSDLVPLVLVAPPGSDYWQSWQDYIKEHLLSQGLINASDLSLFTITDRVDEACEAIASFYRIYHSSRYVGEDMVIRLNSELSDADVATLNDQYADILVKGKICKSAALPGESNAEIQHLPRLVLHFNQRDLGRLYHMIRMINKLGMAQAQLMHPEQK
ncbi:TIGR00730 family Rossman fold protein [Vacuolonema iberomarrocanum]|uniref:LOG family protein n=1 Tax=Vacuolonema iberomarrocanum TaxID=3454632 RepID=UPI0019D97D70|nr:TIGR00730 family Rossman fold protein [filamentous cyanobacterium LEGE 07170]